jgi:hypothetical protein
VIHDRSLGQVLALILIVALVGHLWMQASHGLPRADHQVSAVAAVGLSSHHHGGQDAPEPSRDHAAVCSALPSADHRAGSDLWRCSNVVPAANLRIVDLAPLMRVAQPPGMSRRSPRSPDQGVVLVI